MEILDATLPIAAPLIASVSDASDGFRMQNSSSVTCHVRTLSKGCAMSLTRVVVTAVKVEGRTQSEVAREVGVSRRRVHELCRRSRGRAQTIRVHLPRRHFS